MTGEETALFGPWESASVPRSVSVAQSRNNDFNLSDIMHLTGKDSAAKAFMRNGRPQGLKPAFFATKRHD